MTAFLMVALGAHGALGQETPQGPDDGSSDGGPTWSSHTDTETDVVDVEVSGEYGDEGPSTVVEISGPPPGMVAIAYPLMRGTPGSPDACMARGADWVDEDDEGAARGVRADAWRLSLQGHVTATGAPPEWCDELGNEPVLAARELVEDNLPLLAPVPQPGDNPVVGMPVLVQLGRQPRVELFGESVIVLGQTFPVRATATATTAIEWGDGAIDDGIERRGATYQQVDGDLDDPRLISHVFQDVGTYEVTVIDRWQGEVTVAGLGTFPFSTQLGETMTLQLGERQAVVTSG